MTKKLRILLALIVLAGLALLIQRLTLTTPIVPPNTQVFPTNTEVVPANSGVVSAAATVEPSDVYVPSFEGWGTSLAWWANVTGGWSDSNRNALADLIFGADGLRMNIVRYNIGGSSDSQAGMRPGGLVQSFIDQNNVYDWTRDANQRWMLSAAQSRGANIFEAFSNSPPWFMTIRGDTRGGPGCGNNLKDDQYEAFASYLTEVVKHFRDDWGVNFRTLEPLNEPNGTWWCFPSTRQEGAHFDRAKQEMLLSKVGQQLASKGLSGTKLSAADETSPGDTAASVSSYSDATRNYLDQINTHTYGGDSIEKRNLHNLALKLGKRVWMSEIDGTAGKHNHADILPGLWLAARVTEDINFIKPDAWVFWQVIEDEANMIKENGNWGLIHADMAGDSQGYWITKKYYIMGNYTKFIRPGYQIIASGERRAVAAYDPSSGSLVIVIYNNKTSDSAVTFDLTRFSTLSGPVTPYRTSSTENLVQLTDIPVSNGRFTATMRAQSVTTFVISGVGNAVASIAAN